MVPKKQFKNSPRTLRAIERANQVYELRLKGYPFREIQRILGVSPKTTVRAMALARKLRDKEVEEKALEAFKMDLDRLDYLIQRAVRRLDKDPENPDIKAGMWLLTLLERRAKMFGYDKPVKQITELQYGSWTGPELVEEADRQNLSISSELRQQLMGQTVLQLPSPVDVEYEVHEPNTTGESLAPGSGVHEPPTGDTEPEGDGPSRPICVGGVSTQEPIDHGPDPGE